MRKNEKRNTRIGNEGERTLEKERGEGEGRKRGGERSPLGNSPIR